jgi:enediyne biosynthesis protein E4
LALLAGLPAGLRAQMATRGVKALPRGAPSGRPFHSRLTDVAAQAGLRTPTIFGGEGGSDYIVETIGCGAVFFDYDNDGWLDIFLPCGTRFGDAPKDATNRLYKNNRDSTFTDVTEKSGLVRSGWASGATVGDYNNDGFEDLFLTYWGQNVLYRNNGDGTFTDVTKEAGLLNQKARWGSGCTWVDYDRDGRLDLFVANYLQFDPKTTPRKGQDTACNWKGVAVNCGPRGLVPETHLLYHNNGDGTFSDVSVKSGIAKAKGSYGLTAVAADFDNDGWPDIFVACDSTPSLLFRNNRDGTFTEDGMARGVALNDDGAEQAGMGVAVGDVNLDGNLDILTTHFADDTSTLSINDGKANFRDETLRAGLGVETRFVSWGCGMPDLDNDGYPDLFVVTGSVYPEMERAIPELAYKTPRVLFRNLGNGKFEELMGEGGPGVSAAHSSRGCCFGDFDNDGDLDILINNVNEAPSLLRNDVSGPNHWLKVKLVGVVSNRSAIGGRVTARYGGKVQAQEVLSQSGFLSVSDSRLHFGLGAAEFADLEIRWPNGRKESVAKVPADRLVVIKEGAGIIDSPLGAAFAKPVR